MLKEMLFNLKPDIMLGKMLDKAALNQRVIASNIANVGTPGYERLGVSFEKELIKAVKTGGKLRTTNERHLPEPNWHNKIKPKAVKIEDGYWNGINNVNIDEEMVELGKNQLDFNTAARILGMRFNQLRAAIRGRS